MNTSLMVLFLVYVFNSGVYISSIGKPRKPLTAGIWFLTELITWSLLIWVIMTNGGF